MHTFDLLALAEEHRADREREARLERRRPAPADPGPPRAPKATVSAVAAPCPPGTAACGHAPAAS